MQSTKSDLTAFCSEISEFWENDEINNFKKFLRNPGNHEQLEVREILRDWDFNEILENLEMR